MISYFMSDVKPSLSLMRAIRPFYSAPPSDRAQTQLVWVGNALWDSLAHGGNPDRTQILDQVSKTVLQPKDQNNAVDSILWDLALLQSIHNGVTPPMIEVMNRLQMLPYSFDSNLPIEVYQTLECMQYWAFALADSSLYKGITPKRPDRLHALVQKTKSLHILSSTKHTASSSNTG